MIKKLIEIILGFGLLFGVVYGLQLYLFTPNCEIRFDLSATNLFFAVVSAVICLALYVLETRQKFKPQLGFMYLPTLFIKGVLFYIVFRESVFALEQLSVTERLNLLIPFFIFLALEVYFVSKVINKQ